MSFYRDFVNNAIDSESIVLDLGCGDGKYGAIKENGFKGKILVGLDNDGELLVENTCLSFRVLGDAHRLPFRQNCFDIIISRVVIEHIERPDIVLSEASRVLKLGGVFIIQTPNKLNPISFLSSVLSLRAKAFLKRLFTHECEIEGNYETYYKCNTGRKIFRTLKENGFGVENLVYEDIGLNWIKNPCIRAAFSAYQKMTNLGSFRCLKQQIICVAKKTDQ